MGTWSFQGDGVFILSVGVISALIRTHSASLKIVNFTACILKIIEKQSLRLLREF